MFPFSDDELLKPVLQSIDNVRHVLLKDGGDIEVLNIKDSCVFIRFHGACSGCPSRHETLRNSILAALQRDIHPDIKVIEASQQTSLSQIAK